MENVCKDLREHAMRIVNYEKKEMIPLSDEENKSYEKQNVYYILKKNLVLMIMMMIISIKR